MDLCDISQIKQLLARHGVSFSKKMGQNFLCQRSVPYEIARNANIDSDTCVLEVGPGIGTLTCELAGVANRVVSVELDRRLFPILEETLGAYANTKVLHGDILKTDLRALCREHFDGRRAVVCANLPYYITTPAISALIDSGCFDSITVMVQREVAHRICAAPACGDYGAFSVYVQYYTAPSLVLEVDRTCFIPQPAVDSSVVRLDVRARPPVAAAPGQLFPVVKAAFAQRRKTLLNCLARFRGVGKEPMRQLIAGCGIAPEARGETLSLQAFSDLAIAIDQFQKE